MIPPLTCVLGYRLQLAADHCGHRWRSAWGFRYQLECRDVRRWQTRELDRAAARWWEP